MESRKHAVGLVDQGVSVSEAARLVGVSRQCLHKWLTRRAAHGDKGLAERSRAPRNHPNEVSRLTRKRLVRLKKKYRDEGPKKIRTYFREQYPNERAPAVSTIGLILKESGLVSPRPNRRRSDIVTKTTLTEATEPNHVWAIDYKGEFRVAGAWCYPLTITDTFSRYALTMQAHRATSCEPACQALWRAFGRFGLPKLIRSDNGIPFVSMKAPAGLTRLGVMLTKLGIRRERIDPGKPAQNGRHERFHRSLKGATANPPAGSWNAQQKRFDRYRLHFNETRPHEALAMQTPASLYYPTPRTRPDKLPEIEHPTAQRVICVYGNGEIRLGGTKVFLTHTLAGETVAVSEIADDLFRMSYGPIYLGTYSFQGKTPVFEQAP